MLMVTTKTSAQAQGQITQDLPAKRIMTSVWCVVIQLLVGSSTTLPCCHRAIPYPDSFGFPGELNSACNSTRTSSTALFTANFCRMCF